MLKLNNERNKETLNSLLTEYQICEQKANHYSRVVWTSGSIFIAASFLLLTEATKLLHSEEVNPLKLCSSLMLLILSLITVLFWARVIQRRHGFYYKHAYIRARAIERQLGNPILKIGKLKTNMINNWIHELDNTSNGIPIIRKWLSFLYISFIVFIIFNMIFVISKLSMYVKQYLLYILN